MKLTTLSPLIALALASTAWAASPYDVAYGIQWNFMIGAVGDDGGSSTNTSLDVTSDGTVFVNNRTGIFTWGSGAGGNVCGGVGAISPLGSLLYGTTVSSLPTMTSAGQQYAAGVNAVGNKAYFGVYGAQTQYWTGEDGKSANRAMVWSMNSSGLNSIADQHSLSKFTNATGTLRTDLLQPTSTGLTPVAGQNRIIMSDIRDSTLDMVMVNDMVDGDFGALGDYGGTGLNKSAAGALSNSYQPGIGVYNFTTNTLSGPAKQPIVTYTGAATSWSNHSSYNTTGIDQSTGRYYGGGISHARATSTSTAWDPDGSGPAALIPFVTSLTSTNPAGIGTAYDASHNLLYSVTWDTSGYDIISTIATTNDGSNGVFWAGEKLDDCHIELRDASGAVVWSDTFDMSPTPGTVPGVERVDRVRVDANGDLFVTGYFETGGASAVPINAYETFVRKYKKTGPNTYVVQWSTTSGLAGVQDLIGDTTLDPSDKTLYTVSRTDGQWTNTSGHIYASGATGDILVQKLTAGDFNTDKLVDFADVQLAGTATKPGLTGVDTYDFNGDGNSTLADTTFMITKIMDRLVGDIAQDTLATDVDNADIGRAIGSIAASGKLYLDGDIDWDADVDTADITAVAAAFTGAKAPGKWTNGTPGATLTYRASDGKVWVHAEQATGLIITSFQLENKQGTFATASYTGPAGGSFGGSLKDVTTTVIADTDLTLAGVSGIPSLGKVFPIGMDQAGLEAYLTTAVYTGQQGTGQMRFTLVVGDLPTPYGTWTNGFVDLTNKFANIDFEGDGLSTGVEYVVGGNPTVNDAASIAPTSQYNAAGLVFTFRRTDLANTDPAVTINVFYSTDLVTWTPAQNGVNSVTIAETDNFYGASPGIDQVLVTLPASLAGGGKLFARLGVSGLPTSLLSEDFESGDGGFTAASAGGTSWEHGVVASGTLGGGAVTVGNSGTKCWATDLDGAYLPSTDTKLRSPVIDLTGVSTATLSFAQALDIKAGHTLVVNVIEATTDTIVASGAAVYSSTPDPDINNAPWATVDSITIPGGQKVRIEWHFVGNGDGSYLGAYLDDVKVRTP